MRSILVSVVDDDQDVRQKLSALLGSSKGYSCAATYPDCEAAIRDLGHSRPDVLLMDIGLPGMSGIDGVRIVKHQWPEMEIVMLTVHVEDEVILSSLRSGASGYLLKNSSATEILRAISEVVDGGAPMSMTIARKITESFRATTLPEPLTRREQEVLSRLRQGHSYQAIADGLFIAKDTVKFHIKNIYRKLNVANKVGAVMKQ